MERLAHTYSIIARDPKTGQLGIGVQSHAFACGAIVPWAEAGIGAIATQATADTNYGRLGLALMRAAKTSQQTLAALLAADPRSNVRQVAMIDNAGQVAVHTGKRCIASAGHLVGASFSVQGNLLKGPEVWEKMAKAFVNSEGDFSERLLQALEAGQDAGGDMRGMQSAALMVVPGPNDPLKREMVTNLRVDDHDQPLLELRRLLTIQRGQEWYIQAIHAVETGNMASAHEYQENLRGLVVGTREPLFWYAVTLAEHGHLDEALPLFALVFKIEPIWYDMLDRLVVSGNFPDDPASITKVKSLAKKK
ncbi:MAG: DUF1028 domain-containing protein [Anaerolineae bacterium]|nr:DUF1028 domain-containing protein [Anaerolineae bacterium]